MKTISIYILAIACIFINLNVFADYHSNAPKLSGGGAWELPTSWENLNGPGCAISSNSTIYIDAGDSVFTACSLAISGTPTIIIEGRLTLNGMLLTGNVNFDIRSGGKLTINGTLNFNGNSTMNVTNSGSIIVNGGIMTNGGAYDFKCNGYVEINGFGCDKCTEGSPDVANCIALELDTNHISHKAVEKTLSYIIDDEGFTLMFNGYEKNDVELTIFDVYGNRVAKRHLNITTDYYKITNSDMNVVQTGVYIVTYTINSEIVTYKLVIQ
jgi:hypothetical protein